MKKVTLLLFTLFCSSSWTACTKPALAQEETGRVFRASNAAPLTGKIVSVGELKVTGVTGSVTEQLVPWAYAEVNDLGQPTFVISFNYRTARISSAVINGTTAITVSWSPALPDTNFIVLLSLLDVAEQDTITYTNKTTTSVDVSVRSSAGLINLSTQARTFSIAIFDQY